MKVASNFITGFYALLLAISMLTPKYSFENHYVTVGLHYAKHLLPEMFIGYVVYLIIRYNDFLLSFFINANSEVEPGKEDYKRFYLKIIIGFLMLLMLFLFSSLFFNQSANLFKKRCDYWTRVIPRSLKNELKYKARTYERIHQSSNAVRYYKIYRNVFPGEDTKVVDEKVRELEERIKFSESYYKLSKIDLESKSFSRESFFMLYTSSRINPENGDVLEIINVKVKYLKSLNKIAKEFHHSLCQGKLAKSRDIFKKYDWYLIENKSIPFYHDGNLNQVKKYVCSFSEENYLRNINTAWELDLIDQFVKWAQEMNKKGEQVALKIEY